VSIKPLDLLFIIRPATSHALLKERHAFSVLVKDSKVKPFNIYQYQLPELIETNHGTLTRSSIQTFVYDDMFQSSVSTRAITPPSESVLLMPPVLVAVDGDIGSNIKDVDVLDSSNNIFFPASGPGVKLRLLCV
jgi:hypothetical protein